MKKKTSRALILTVGVASMLFAGVIYAWSILKSPLASELGFDTSSLALCFTLTMCCFCIGGLVGSRLAARFGTKPVGIAAGIMAGMGIALTGMLENCPVVILYLTYAVMGGLGIGVIYNVIISTVSLWFPDKKGLASGALMMGFGASTLILGNIAAAAFKADGIGWRSTYIALGIIIGATLATAASFIRKPREEDEIPKAVALGNDEEEKQEFTPVQMISRFSFWRAIIALVCLTAVGSSVISFAKDLALSVGAEDALATTLVGVLAVFNGIGRILTGKSFDLFGRRKTMIMANALTILAAAVTLLSVYISSALICVIGLCLVGMSYGSSPTISSAFTMEFYGKKNFPTNFSIMNFNLIGASFIATGASALFVSFGGYTAPFALLLVLAVASLCLTLSLRRP